MSILNDIVTHKRREVAERKMLYPKELLERSMHFEAPCLSMQAYLRRPQSSGIIAEIKRRSPSKGEMCPDLDVEPTSIGYMQAGASGLSVLTDQTFFGGSNEDLLIARQFNLCPILRKDFIIDEYQVLEARSIGADVILLIAAILEPAEVQTLSTLARSLGMEVLLEIHNEEELNHMCDTVDLIGVNNRNLNDFSVSLSVSEHLAKHIPGDFLRVSESGIHRPEDIVQLQTMGYEGFLMGERFVKTGSPKSACLKFINALQALNPQLQLA